MVVALIIISELAYVCLTGCVRYVVAVVVSKVEHSTENDMEKVWYFLENRRIKNQNWQHFHIVQM